MENHVGSNDTNSFRAVKHIIGLAAVIFSGVFFPIITAVAQPVHVAIGTASAGISQEVKLTLIHRFQSQCNTSLQPGDDFDNGIHSPKSVLIHDAKRKFYVNSLEGGITAVYSLDSFRRLKIIRHSFTEKNRYLFHDSIYFDYTFPADNPDHDSFTGKPVESCLTHDGRYLWVTYYRRSWDENASYPSALCIIDTETDSIVRVMPTAPLPKMIAFSSENQTVAVTHWGDNTVGLIDVSASDPDSFKYVAHASIDYRMQLSFPDGRKVDRDHDCGNCLRGTVFTPDGNLILIGKMGSNSIGVIDATTYAFAGSIKGMMPNIRHLLIRGDWLYLSINKAGYVQRARLSTLMYHFKSHPENPYNGWESVYVGEGARTIASDEKGAYVFVAVNNLSRLVVVRTKDMKVIATCPVDSYPVGMDLSEDGKRLIVTSQGKSGKGGNSVMIFDVAFSSK